MDDNDYYTGEGTDYITYMEDQVHELWNEVRQLKLENRGGKAVRMSYGEHICGQKQIWYFLIK